MLFVKIFEVIKTALFVGKFILKFLQSFILLGDLLINSIQGVSVLIDELILHADVTCIVLISYVQHEFAITYLAS